VILHVGTHKTGTTYLQSLMWNNREVLRRNGVLYPAKIWNDHRHASRDVRESLTLHPEPDRVPTNWNRLLEAVRGFDGTVVISHENFGPATAEQAQSALKALEPAEIHVVVTARSVVWTFPSLWVENVKFHSTGTLRDFARDVDDPDPMNFWGWRDLDVSGVVARWGATLPPERVHVITVPTGGAPRSLLWDRLAGVIGIDPSICDASVTTPNESLGVVEVELLRKVNGYLGRKYNDPVVAGRWLRTYLSAEVLAPRRGDRCGPDPEQEAFLRKKAVDIVETLRDARYDVVGELEDLLPPDGPIDWRHPDDVTPAELADAGAATIARVLDDLRNVTGERDRLRKRVQEAEAQLRRQRRRPLTNDLDDRLRRAVRRAPRLAEAIRRLRQTRRST
jgi:hypothetical protein